MGIFKKKEHTDERPKREQPPDAIDPAPWLGQVGDGHTLESGEQIVRKIRELRELRHRPDVNTDAPVSSDPEMPIPDPESNPHDR
jgi:hypothetical protein